MIDLRLSSVDREDALCVDCRLAARIAELRGGRMLAPNVTVRIVDVVRHAQDHVFLNVASIQEARLAVAGVLVALRERMKADGSHEFLCPDCRPVLDESLRCYRATCARCGAAAFCGRYPVLGVIRCASCSHPAACRRIRPHAPEGEYACDVCCGHATGPGYSCERLAPREAHR